MEKNFKELPSHRHCRMRTVPSISAIWPVYMYRQTSMSAICDWKRRCTFHRRFRRTWGTHHHPCQKEGITPQDVVDRYHFLIKKSFEEFGISFDVYSRTSSKTHHELASDFSRPCMKRVSSSKNFRTILWRRGTPVPGRPLYHRRMSALPLGRCLWRPMWKVWNFTFTYRFD